MITERDWENIKSTARREGREEGLKAGLAQGRSEVRLAVAKNLKALGISMTDIAKATGLTHEEIEAL